MNASPSSNSSHGILIALVVVSLLASLGTMGLLVRQQNRSASAQRELLTTLAALRSVPVPSSATTNRQEAPRFQNDDWTTVTHDGVTLSYPKNLSATTFEDEFTSGQLNLRISSSATRKVGIDSRNFRGYELVMRQIDDRQYSDNRKESTVNPRVSSIVEMCDGETCPDAQYIFIKNGKQYLIEVLYQMTPYQAGVDLNNRVIASVK